MEISRRIDLSPAEEMQQNTLQYLLLVECGDLDFDFPD